MFVPFNNRMDLNIQHCCKFFLLFYGYIGVVRLIEETLDKITAIKQQEAGEKSRATRQHVQPPMSIEDIQTRCVTQYVFRRNAYWLQYM